MKQSRVIRIVIFAANLVLAAVCLVAYVREDKVKPEFMFQASDSVYTESGQKDLLLQDITASDDRDGDITERIVIEKVTENRDSSTVVVYYAVSDSAGNVAKTSRVFPAVFDETEHEEAAQTFAMAEVPKVEILKSQTDKGQADEGGSEKNGEDGSRTDEEKNREDTDERKEDSEEDSDDGQDEEDEIENGREEDDGQAAADENENRPDETGDAEENGHAQERETPAGSGAPVLTLRKAEVTIEAGTTPPWTEIIETLQDDKDDYATLYYNLNVSRFNRNQQGDYPVTLYTEDSDGNCSETVTVMVHVKGNG